MRYRALVAIAFVVVVGALIVLRDQGYLGGRLRGGPLRVGTGHDARRAEKLAIVTFPLGADLAGDPVRVQNVRVRLRSPGLRVHGPDLGTGGSLEDATLRRPVPPVRIGLQAEAPGVYYALGLITDYRRGQRRYRDREAQTLCISIGPRQRCNLGYRGPGAARVAQVGGPARYRGAELSPRTATYAGPGTYRVRLTIANQTRSVIEVAKVGLDRDPGVTATGPEPFVLRPHAYREIGLTLAARACGARRFDRLRADLDGERRSIPLSLPLRFAC